MSRTLTRPMFRKGGMAQREKYMGGGIKTIRPKYMGGGMTGIMSGIRPDAGLTPRVGYADGPSLQEIIAAQELKDPSTIIYDKDYIQKLLDQKTRKLYEPGLPGYGQQIATPDTPTQKAIKEFLETNPEGAYELFKKGEIPGFGDTDYGALQAAQAKKAKEAGIDLNLGETKTETSGAPGGGDPGMFSEPKKKQTVTQQLEDTPSDQDTIKSYMDMFQAALGEDQDDITRDKYLQLAKFGANLLAQPGGDLVGAVGKAAAPSIEGLAKTQAAQRAGKREINLAAIKTALGQMDPTELEKRYDFLKGKFPDKSDIEIANMLISGETGKARTQESRIISNAESLTNLDPAFRIIVARSIEKSGIGFEKFRQLPKDKDGNIKKDKEGNLPKDGFYYDEEGNLYRIEKGELGELKV